MNRDNCLCGFFRPGPLHGRDCAFYETYLRIEKERDQRERIAKVEEQVKHLTKIAKEGTVSPHYGRVAAFMVLAGQEVRTVPTLPSPDERVLRARLILEEALETVAALGVALHWDYRTDFPYPVEMSKLVFADNGKPDLMEIADGCADVSVVTTGTLISCGILDEKLLQEVDSNNLAKFGPGGYRDENGKWRKPPGHQPPDIKKILTDQGAKL